MLLTNLPRHYSAEVRLYLETSKGTFSLAQIGPNDVIFAKPVDLPPCDAEVVMSIDGTVTRWPVRLANGVTSSNQLSATTPR